jgi:phosphatidylglycerophosphate synthase
MGLSPNRITSASLLLAVLSAISLANQSPALFTILWALSVVLDYTDGQVARMTGVFSTFRFDHYSDVAKMGLVLVATGIYFSESEIWVIVSLALAAFYSYSLMNDALSRLRFDNSGRAEPKSPPEALSFIKPAWLRRVVGALHILILSVNGHTLLLFLIIPFSIEIGGVILTYLCAVFVINLASTWIHIFRALPSLTKGLQS